MRAVLYARVSTTDRQDPEVQLAELREYASRRGWELCGTFVDRTSGSRESRPALDEVMSLCQQRKADVVIVWKLGELGYVLHRNDVWQRFHGYRFQRNVRTLPGSPDLVFAKDKLAVFVDGDFWHGFRYPCWRHKIQPFWRNKIETNRKRDQRNFRRLRRAGWNVLRIWQHEIETDTASCLHRIVELLPLQTNANNR